MKIEVKVKDQVIKIYINKIPHLLISQCEFQGLQSWIEEIEENPYVIEFTLRGSVIRSEYTSKQLWEQILKKLDKEYPLTLSNKAIGFNS